MLRTNWVEDGSIFPRREPRRREAFLTGRREVGREPSPEPEGEPMRSESSGYLGILDLHEAPGGQFRIKCLACTLLCLFLSSLLVQVINLFFLHDSF